MGISNLLSDVVESICSSIKDPFEVISSEDMLHRFEVFNKEVADMIIDKKKDGVDYDWREEYMVLGSDVKSLFPSMTRDNTAKAVRKQAEKSNIKWQNIDSKWLRLYIHLNRHLCSNLEPVKHLLPTRRKGRRGAEPGLGSFECTRRYITDEYLKEGKMVKSFWVWPDKEPTEAEMKILMAIMLEVSIKFFYDNFVYSFGGKNFVQSSGGPIGARLTMAMSRLVMQQWWEDFDKILSGSNIDCKMRAIYVDDGRMIIKKLQKGARYCNVQKKFIMKVDCQEEDADLTRESISEREFRKAMCDVSEDLEFTTETEKEFKNGRLPTLSFQMWSEKASNRYSY